MSKLRKVLLAMHDAGVVNDSLAYSIAREAVSDRKVKRLLDDSKLPGVSSSYELRQKREELLHSLGYRDDLGLGINALIVLEKRYLRKDVNGRVIETPRGLFKRVASFVAGAERNYGGDVRAYAEEFYNMMCRLEFLPNSPTLMNAGTEMSQLSGCFVLPLKDSLEHIFATLKDSALIHQSGGGVGFNFSHLRPKGDIVKSTGGVASGPVSFMRVFDVTTDVVKQGGRRRGANMAVLDYNHPDIIEFINAKQGGGFSNFNFSVGVNDEFMSKVINGGSYWLVNPRNNERVRKVNAKEVFGLIVKNAWSDGEPGVLFMDEINRKSVLAGRIESTNPCGEIPALSYESCNLGSINLSLMIKDGLVDWSRLARVVRLAVRFLDDVIDVNKYPLREIDELTRANRKIGLGVMGFADLLVQLGVSYDSSEGVVLARELMSFIQDKAREESMHLAFRRGSFPNFRKSKLVRKYSAMRNATVTAIAPTGSISIIAGCSSGIEPLFAVSFARNILDGSKLLEVNPFFEKTALREGFYSPALMREIALSGNLSNVKGVPERVKRVFVTALEVSPEWHVRMQSEFQKCIDNGVSKTVNLPASASIADVAKVFLLAYRLKCKGVTVYRYGSKSEQVLTLNPEKLSSPKCNC